MKKMKKEETKNENEFNIPLISPTNPLFKKVIENPNMVKSKFIEYYENGREVNLPFIMKNILHYKYKLKRNKRKHYKILLRMFKDVENFDTTNSLVFSSVFMDLWEDIFKTEENCLSVTNKRYKNGIEFIFKFLINGNLKTI
jgi:hypothetical protein